MSSGKMKKFTIKEKVKPARAFASLFPVDARHL